MHRFVWMVGLSTAVGLFIFTRQHFDRLASGVQQSPWPTLLNEMTAAWLAGLLVLVVLTIADRWPPDRPRRWLAYALGFVVFAFLHTSGMALSRHWLYGLFNLGQFNYGDMGYRFLMEAPVQAVVYILTLILFSLSQRLRKAKEAERLQALLDRARLEQLRLSIAPHFLFNTLNTISAVAYESAEKADALIGRLSRLLRALLDTRQDHTVPLTEELVMLEEYLEIQRARFEHRLDVQMEIAPNSKSWPVPFMLLQPVVENALQHGADAGGRVMIKISTRLEDDGLIIDIADQGSGPDQDDRAPKGIGVSNTIERLNMLYGDKAGFSLSHCESGGALCQLRLPAP
ncbi:MAG: hypothetical protein DHS20C11_09570 [Lysobacteraceae bacterium]|nr:MAG: hypothetical protein DHS20C11_09570 [Xanthomonadaceae bacterium]